MSRDRQPGFVIRNRTGQSGIAMVTVLFVTAAVMLLAITFSVIAMSERRSTASGVQTELAVQIADGGSEQARRVVIDVFDKTFLSISNFLEAVGEGDIPELAGVHTAMVDGNEVYWQIAGVSDPNASFGWIDVAATAAIGRDAAQTVIRRVGFGASSTFNLAMLSETTNCMFCHLRVNGDVGNLVEMRPGWGHEGGDGKGSGGSLTGLGISRINGNVFAAQDITNDETSGNRLNGAEVTGVIERFSTNAALPTDTDGDGIPDFPPINREIAIENARGTVSGGVGNCLVPLGGSYTGSCSTGVNRSGTIDGNLVLIGTIDNPINLDGDIWVEGDVVIKGYYTGQGGIYSGRNVYLAGDVQSVNPPYSVVDGACVDENGIVQATADQMAATGFSPQDACARLSIRDDTDTLRLAARGSIVVGDYTEYDGDGNQKGAGGRQSSMFYREQFGLTGNRSFDASTGDELRCSGSTCVNADNEVVNNRVNADSYNGTIRPGRVTSSGFSEWMSDAQYSEILGTEEYSYNNWRAVYSTNNRNQVIDMMVDLMKSGFGFEGARAIADRKTNFDDWTNENYNNLRNRLEAAGFAIPAGYNRGNLERQGQGNGLVETVDATGNPAWFNWSNSTLRVVHVGTQPFETQVNRIDAFLYANQRIAGRTAVQAMSITGGLVARDLGILAPGRGLEVSAFGDVARELNAQRGDCSDPDSEYYVYGSEDCALTVNYDHRLRNGGYGYNIIQGQIGITLDWRLADSAGEQVRP